MLCKVKNIIMWALTYRCNMHCDYCFLNERVKCWDELTDDECISVAKKIAYDNSWKPDAIWLTGGEPTVRKCLNEIIEILESNGIKCVITTNGFCSEELLKSIIEAKPRGINVSLESFDDEINSINRGNTLSVINSIKYISENKSKDTILGVSCVISPQNISEIISFSKDVKELGVEYLSINPLIGGNSCYSIDNFTDFKTSYNLIKSSKELLLPSDFYFNLVEDYFLKKNEVNVQCPSGKNYMFISPWGNIYPCSNEMWQNQINNNIKITDDCNMKGLLEKITKSYNTDTFTTKGPCFGERCIGCWKLYFDTIFTK